MSKDRAAADASGTHDGARPAGWRASLRDQALRNAMRKRSAGVPTYSVPEAAALLWLCQPDLAPL